MLEHAVKGALTAFEGAPNDLDTRRVLTDAYLALGDASARSGDPAGARRSWTRALETVDSLARSTRQTDLLALEATALLRLDRADDALPFVRELLHRGYRKRSVVELARAKGLPAVVP